MLFYFNNNPPTDRRASTPPPKRLIPRHSMMSFRSMSFVMMLILQEKIFKSAIEREGDGGDAQAGESAFEAVPPCEGARVSPFLPGRQ